MSKVAIIYWSGTGNTEKMAEAIYSRLKEKEVDADLIQAGAFTSADADKYNAFAFGCPAMGNEELEEGEFEPMFESVEDSLANKATVIFGSYEWNDGQWMIDWQERCEEHDINLAANGLTAYGEPGEEDINACYDLADSLIAML